jgi:cell wall-associated NlpC family hydrolase
MITRQAIATEALTWLGTPWHHHQCCKGAGVDCVQLLYGVGREIGFIPQDFVIENYYPLARGSFLVRHLEHWLVRVDSISKGSVLLFTNSGLLTHVGIMLDANNFIHASAQRKKVVLDRLADYQAQLRQIYDVPGVLNG